ncbi:MAG TPA: hypothetical protein VLT57_15100 [Bryobacteraceae bacterium]|nr:hypothetical protein [Bryobacteraceae bacterium]
MSRFAEDALGLLETAEAARRLGGEAAETAILISERGGIRIVSEPGWSLDGLRAHYGARTAYRLSLHQGTIRVEGKEPGQACVLESESPARAARFLLPHAALRW